MNHESGTPAPADIASWFDGAHVVQSDRDIERELDLVRPRAGAGHSCQGFGIARGRAATVLAGQVAALEDARAEALGVVAFVARAWSGPFAGPEHAEMQATLDVAGLLDLLEEAEVEALSWVQGTRSTPAAPDLAMSPRNQLIHDIVAGAVRQLTPRDLLGTRERAEKALDAHLHAALEPRNVLATALASESQELREIAYRAAGREQG